LCIEYLTERGDEGRGYQVARTMVYLSIESLDKLRGYSFRVIPPTSIGLSVIIGPILSTMPAIVKLGIRERGCSEYNG